VESFGRFASVLLLLNSRSWYTVGYKMTITIEQQYGRDRLVQCLTDIWQLLPTYTRAAQEKSKKGSEAPVAWSAASIQAREQKPD